MYSVTYVLMIMSPLVAVIALALAIIYIVLTVQAKKANLSVYDLLIWPVWFVPCMCLVVSVLAMAGTFLDEQAGTSFRITTIGLTLVMTAIVCEVMRSVRHEINSLDAEHNSGGVRGGSN